MRSTNNETPVERKLWELIKHYFFLVKIFIANIDKQKIQLICSTGFFSNELKLNLSMKKQKIQYSLSQEYFRWIRINGGRKFISPEYL